MKYYKYNLLTAIIILLFKFSFAQNINWKTLQPSQRHIVNLNVGFDNATTVGIGYGYHFNTKMPLVVNVEYSMPMGNIIFDDFKTKIGGQLDLLRINSFHTSAKAYGIIRRFQNDMTRMVNFGSEFSATAGIYKDKWFAAGEIGFDKAITTHIKHSDLMKEYNPSVQSGWYIPTGGNLLYGLQGGYSFSRYDVYAKVGRTLSQDFKTQSMIPYYFQVGWNMKW
jgi:hypothetical protein